MVYFMLILWLSEVLLWMQSCNGQSRKSRIEICGILRYEKQLSERLIFP